MTLKSLLSLSPRITMLPVIHGSGDFAVQVRHIMLNEKFDCVAVPLPPSFQDQVEAAIDYLPTVTVVAQSEPLKREASTDWTPERDADSGESEKDERRTISYVPIDPCQPVIAALRIALQEHIPRAFIDAETAEYHPVNQGWPDPYALKRLSVEKFSASILPLIPPLSPGQVQDRVRHMAHQLRKLELKYSNILCLCSILEWPWIQAAYQECLPPVEGDEVEPVDTFTVDPRTLTFLLGELPFITALYERCRHELDDDENLSLDGVKELLVETREKYKADLRHQAREITPHLLATYFRYVRNLCLIERRMTPDLYTLVSAAQQIAGDQFALHLAELAREYSYSRPLPFETISFGVDQARLPDGDVVAIKNRLPGPPLCWRHLQLQRRPSKKEKQLWQMKWNPYSQCSWPPEDVAIENFRTHVKERAMALLGNDLARSEKFSTSLFDGLDIRETLRNWHTGDLYVKIIPPTRGKLDCAIMLFDTPADPREYPWRATWMAEHEEESTLALFATDFQAEMVGPGIGMATYGGAMFLFPPRYIPEIWMDRKFDFATTLEERLLAAGCCYSQEKHVALLSPAPPGIAWKRIAKKYGKKLVHVPLNRFSQATIQQLRIVHVLNGTRIRSFAADFIRKA